MSTSTLLDPTLGVEGREAENTTTSTAEPATSETNESQSFCNAIVHRDSEKLQELNESPKDHELRIRKQGDDLTIAICEIDETHGLQKHNLNPHDSKPSSASSLELRDPRVLTLSHYRGDSFDVPWVLCEKWTWMKEIIKLTYGSDEDAKKNIDEGTFTLRQMEGRSLFLPKHWNLSVRPWQCVEIRLNSQEEDTDSDSEYGSVKPYGQFGGPLSPPDTAAKQGTAGAHATLESAMIPAKYRIDFHSKPRYAGQQETFLYSRTWDTPVVIRSSNLNGESDHVLEEIHHVSFGTSRGAWKKDGVNVSDPSLILSPDDTVRPKRLHIRSSFLLNALRSLVRYSSNDTEPLVDGIFPFPFKELYHHREELLEYQNGSSSARSNHTLEDNEKCDRHIGVLLDYLDKEPTVQLQSVKSLWAQKVPTTTFAGFWLLLKPGSDVYITEYGQLNACVLDMVYGGMEYSSRTVRANDYEIHVWYLVFDGKVIKRKSKVIDVPVFDGEREIMSLPIFPTYFRDQLDGGSLRRTLIERGEKVFCYAKGPTFLEYSGSGLKQGTKKYHRTRVVVEHQSLPWTLSEFSGASDWVLSTTDNIRQAPRNIYPMPPLPPSPGNTYQYQGTGPVGPASRARVPRCECFECKLVDSTKGTGISLTFSDYDSLDPGQAKGLSEHQALLCMSHMFGFILKDRTYDILDVNGLSEPTLAENAIDELVMRPEKNKEMIKAIVKTYTDSDSQAELMGVDFIRGKGEGQIFLLHGPPGTGKTLTAESVAEYTKRPLLSITAADLGHEPIELERNLLRFFRNATAWDAIVLLDEADIYLARRSTKDLRRNGIVSIFLRALDYFEGIIFFTTNRVGHFDEAFMSRIHVAVGYEPLDDQAREQIWESFFRRLKENHRDGGPRIDYDYDAKQYVRKSEEVKSLQWNGREIRNAFQTAVALAIAASKTAKQKGRPEADCVPQLTEAHLSQVVQLSAAFKAYTKATHEDLTEADLAFKLGNRYDQPDRKEY